MHEDNSLEAIRRRYDIANELAIVQCDRLTFASLQDVLTLINQIKELQQEVIILKDELKNLQETDMYRE